MEEFFSIDWKKIISNFNIKLYYYITLIFYNNHFLYCNARNFFYLGINRFCEFYRKHYVSDRILRQKIMLYVSFWQGKKKKKKKFKIPRFFHQKNGDATRKSFQKLRKQYIPPLHTYKVYVCKCVPEMSNRGYFDWRILNIYAQNVKTFLSNVNYNSKNWYFSMASSKRI